MNQRDIILSGLRALAESRPGFDPGLYVTAAAYNRARADSYRALRDCRAMLAAMAGRPDISAAAILSAAQGTRVEIKARTAERGGGYSFRYCPGWNGPAEIRPAIAQVCARALRDSWLDSRPADSSLPVREIAAAALGRRIARAYF